MNKDTGTKMHKCVVKMVADKEYTVDFKQIEKNRSF